MTAPRDDSRSEIYDLGYRNYDGPRRGRAYAVRSLCVLSVRNTFGLGRGSLPKVLAFGLTVLAFVPALVQLITAALVGPSDFSVLKPEDYFSVIQIVLVLFVAAMASDLVGNDRRNNTLVLYFSRPIRRDDYVLAKILSLAIALLALTLLPQLLAFAGNWLGARDSTAWFTDNASDLVRIAVSSVLVSVMLAAIGVAIATFASRRAIAMITVIGIFLFSFLAASILVGLLDPLPAGLVLLISPLYVIQGVVLALFDAIPVVTPDSSTGDPADLIAYADFPGWAWFVALLVQTALATLVAMRRSRQAL